MAGNISGQVRLAGFGFGGFDWRLSQMFERSVGHPGGRRPDLIGMDLAVNPRGPARQGTGRHSPVSCHMCTERTYGMSTPVPTAIQRQTQACRRPVQSVGRLVRTRFAA